MGDWTSEPWDVQRANIENPNGPMLMGVGIVGQEDHVLFPDVGLEDVDAERIVACVNACAGIKDPSVVKELVKMMGEYSALLCGCPYTKFNTPCRPGCAYVRAQELLKKV